MLKDILQDITLRLCKIKELRYVASNWGQLDYEQPPVQWPCALVDVQGADFSALGSGSLLGEAQVSIQIVNRPTVQTSARSPRPAQDCNLILLDIADQIYAALHAVDAETHTPFVLKNITKTNLTDLQSYTLTFKVGFKQHKPDETTKVEPTPNFSMTAVRPSVPTMKPL